MRYILDSNIWIAILRRQTVPVRRLRQALVDEDEIVITPIEYFEVMRGLELRGKRDPIEYLTALWLTLPYRDIDRETWEIAVRLWIKAVKENRKREDADILLAALATRHRACLVTNNTEDFQYLGLEPEDWTVG